MTYKTKKEFIKIYRDQVKEAAGDNEALYKMLVAARNDYHEILEMNMQALKAKVKIQKVLTAYIIERYQIINDVYYYGIIQQ